MCNSAPTTPTPAGSLGGEESRKEVGKGQTEVTTRRVPAGGGRLFTVVQLFCSELFGFRTVRTADAAG
jgi:hypothetical protein